MGVNVRDFDEVALAGDRAFYLMSLASFNTANVMFYYIRLH